jgi:hypothetical protein
MDSGPTGLDTRVKQANKQPETNTRSKVGEWRGIYLEASRMADPNDTGICDAVHNAEPKVGMDSRTHREGIPVSVVSA